MIKDSNETKVKATKTILANTMRKLRAKKGWSQERLADECGLHRTYIGAVERCEQNISIESIVKISTALEVEVWQLFISNET